MAKDKLVSRWAAETLGMMLVGDGVVTLIDPERHARLWMKGPSAWRRAMERFIEHPGITRALAAVEVGLGVWLAQRQRPVSPGEKA